MLSIPNNFLPWEVDVNFIESRKSLRRRKKCKPLQIPRFSILNNGIFLSLPSFILTPSGSGLQRADPRGPELEEKTDRTLAGISKFYFSFLLFNLYFRFLGFYNTGNLFQCMSVIEIRQMIKYTTEKIF